MSDVHVVGCGVISAAGSSVDSFWSALLQGQSLASLQEYGPNNSSIAVHAVLDDDWSKPFSTSEVRRIDRFALLGMAAMQQAVTDAGTAWLDAIPTRRALHVGVGFGGITTLVTQHETLQDVGWRRLSPFGIAAVMPSCLAAYGSIKFDIEGEAATVSSACASGTQAIAHGSAAIARGDADIVLVGGSEAPLQQLPILSFARMDALVSEAEDPTKVRVS